MNTTNLSTVTKTDLVPANAWALLPPLGNLDAYISAINRLPMLTLEEEQTYARQLRDNNDLTAASRLVMSHLRLVVSISRQYLGYGLPQGDLIQEGNIGLMKAVKRFDPDQGVRLVSYAIHWIKAEIHEFILRNWRMVKVATTKAQRRLFFNLRSMKNGLKAESMEGADGSGAPVLRDSLSSSEIDTMVEALNVRREDVIEMEARMSAADVQLDPTPAEDGEGNFTPIAWLADMRSEPTAVLESREHEKMASHGISEALATLDPRSRHIVEQRWLNVNDDGTGGMTLHELAAQYKVSAERIRQIEVAAMKKMRKSLAAFAA